MHSSGSLPLLDDYLVDFWQTIDGHWLTLPSPMSIKVWWEHRGLIIRGRLDCLDGLSLDLRMRLLVVKARRPLCTVEDYSIQGQRFRLPLFRYDNASHYPDHATPHHRHFFDPAGAKVEPPEHVGGVPTLAEVLDELGRWYSARNKSEV